MLPSSAFAEKGEVSPEHLRAELEGARRELGACRDDLAEAYAMLAKAGLDWARERQEKAQVEARLEALTSEHVSLTSQQLQGQGREVSAELAGYGHHLGHLQAAGPLRAHRGEDAMQIGEGSATTRASSSQAEAIAQQVVGLTQRVQELTQLRDALTQQLEEARRELREEQERRQGLEELSAAVLKLSFDAKEEAEKEREQRQNAEQVAATVLQWAAREREDVAAEQARLAQERRELELGHRWREYNVRIKLQEGQMEVLEKVQKLDALEKELRARCRERGLAPLWHTRGEEIEAQELLFSLRQPFYSNSAAVAPSAVAGAPRAHPGLALALAGLESESEDGMDGIESSDALETPTPPPCSCCSSSSGAGGPPRAPCPRCAMRQWPRSQSLNDAAGPASADEACASPANTSKRQRDSRGQTGRAASRGPQWDTIPDDRPLVDFPRPRCVAGTQGHNARGLLSQDTQLIEAGFRERAQKRTSAASQASDLDAVCQKFPDRLQHLRIDDHAEAPEAPPSDVPSTDFSREFARDFRFESSSSEECFSRKTGGIRVPRGALSLLQQENPLAGVGTSVSTGQQSLAGPLFSQPQSRSQGPH